MFHTTTALRRSAVSILAIGLLATSFPSYGNVVTYELFALPVTESAGSVDVVFRLTAQIDTLEGQDNSCFIDGEILLTTPPDPGVASAEDGTDYDGASFSAGFSEFYFEDPGTFQQDFTFTLSLIADTLVEPITEQFGLLYQPVESIGNPCFGEPIPNSVSAVGMINDDDALQFGYSPTSVNQPEASGAVSVDLDLLNPAEAPAFFTATVPTSAVSGTAFAGNDFVPVAQDLNFSPAVASQPFGVTLIDDGIVEPDESFSIANNGVVSAIDDGGFPLLVQVTNAVAVTIANDDVPDVVEITSPSIAVVENGASAEVQVLRSGSLAGPVSVSYATSDDSALAGSDYQAVSGTLNFAEGEAGPLTIAVPLVDDTAHELGESFSLALSAPVNADLGVSSAAVNITDDDTDDVGFALTTQSVDESTGSIIVDVVRAGSALAEVSVAYTTAAGTATQGSDFTTTSGTLSFPAGELGPLTIEVPIADDADDEIDETFDLVLSAPSGPVTLGVSIHTITIADNDEPPVVTTYQFTTLNANAVESAGDVALQVSRTGDLTSPGSVDFATENGSAVAGSDYVAEVGTIVFPVGEAGPLPLTVGLVDNADSEALESFSVVLSNPVGGSIADSAGVATLNIEDNDSPGGSPDVTLSGVVGSTVSHSFTSALDFASRATDLSESSVTPQSSSGSVTVAYQFAIPAGARVGSVFQDRVSTNFGEDEFVVEQFIRIEVTEIPPAEGDLVFPSGDLTLTEDSGEVTITVVRNNGTDGQVSVDYSALAATASAADDFVMTPGTLTWASGEGGEKSFTLTIVDDDEVEELETFTLELGNFSASGTAGEPRLRRAATTALAGGVNRGLGLGTPSSIVITIDDNDVGAPVGSVSFVSDSITVNESEGTAEIEVARSGAPLGLVSVDWATVGDSAEEGGDFTGSSGTLVWQDGDTANKTISVELQTDVDIEGVEAFMIELSNPQGAVFGATAEAVVSISDVGRNLADVPGLSVEERAFATALDSSCNNLIANDSSSTTDQQDLLFICGTVRNGLETTEQAREAIDALSGDELITAATSTLKLLGLQHNTFRNRLSGLRSGNTSGFDVSGLAVEIDGQYLSGPVLEELFGALTGGAASGDDGAFGRLSFYVNGKLEFGEKDRDSANRGYDFDAQMLTFGADYRLTDQVFVGAALGYEMADVDFAQGGALDVGGWKGSIYGSYFSGESFYVDAQASYGRDNYESERKIRYDYVGGSIDRTAEGSTSGDQFTSGIASGFDFNRGRLTFGPNAALSYFNVGVKSFSETGAGGLNLDIGRQQQQSLTLTAGAHLSYVINTKLGVLIPNARIDYIHEFLTAPEFSNVRFSAASSGNESSSVTTALQVEAETIDKDYLLWSVGTSAQFIHGVSGYLNYQSTEGYTGLKLRQVAYGFRYEKAF